MEEAQLEIKSLKGCKAQGYDDIPAEMIKEVSEEGIQIYHAVCKKTWKEETSPYHRKTILRIRQLQNNRSDKPYEQTPP